MKEGSALKVVYQFAIGELVACKLVAYKIGFLLVTDLDNVSLQTRLSSLMIDVPYTRKTSSISLA